MSTLSTRSTLPFAVSPDAKLLGEVITWSCAGVSIQLHDLITALRESDLDESTARELAPRHAFARACKKLSDRRIIRQLAEDTHTIHFQFTAEQRDGDRYTYELETVLTLEKATGKVSCDLPGLATLAQEALDQHITTRSAADVTRVIQRLFERNADLFPIRDYGGVYFVPAGHITFLDRVDRFVRCLNGSMRRFPVPAGTPQGDRSVREAVSTGLEALIEDHLTAIRHFDTDTRPDTIERAAERIRQTRFKIEAYATYLGSERDRLERHLTIAAQQLHERIDAMAPLAS